MRSGEFVRFFASLSGKKSRRRLVKKVKGWQEVFLILLPLRRHHISRQLLAHFSPLGQSRRVAKETNRRRKEGDDISRRMRIATKESFNVFPAPARAPEWRGRTNSRRGKNFFPFALWRNHRLLAHLRR